MGLKIVLFLGLPGGAFALSSAFLYTGAPQYDVDAWLHAGDRFPAGAEVRVFSNGSSHPLVPSLATSADPALSPDARSVLLSGKQRPGQPWQIWEVPLAGGAPRQVTSCSDDCIRPFYASPGLFVYAREGSQGFQIEFAPLTTGAQWASPARLTWLDGNFLPDGVLRDGRVIFEAGFPAGDSKTRELYTVYTDGTGVEARRCDHGPDRQSGTELANGDLIFQTGTGFAKFTSARAGQVELTLPTGQYTGPVAEVEGSEWLASYRATADQPYWICRVAAAGPGKTAQPVKIVGPNAFQPVSIRVSATLPYHPSSVGNRDGANLLCLNSYTSKSQTIPKNSVSEVRVWSQNRGGVAVVLGKAPVEPDGSFYVQTPSEAPLRFELLDRLGRTIATEKGWFWTRKGEQRVCVGCHAGPERAPDNVVPQVLLRTQKAVPVMKAAE